MVVKTLVILSLCGSIATASPIAGSAVVKRSVDEIKDAYDYIVVGGGTSGLAVANRLSEDPSKQVLVVEIGYFADESCIWMPSGGPSFGGPAACAKHAFNETGVPQPGINDKSFTYAVGAAVGGSSAINGMFFDRGSKSDYDAWGELGNPGWNWESLFGYFRKSTTFTPPADQYVKKYGYTWDKEAYGNGPIQATLPPFQWEGIKDVWNAWDDLNVTGPKEHALGNAVGRFWVPASQHPVNQTRSYARYGYYDPIQQRTNFHLLVGHKVEKLVIANDLSIEGVILYQRDNPKEKTTVKANGETILAAGAAHTPQLLELSGIGSKKVLEAAGIELKVDLPGVGENFQDHPQVMYGCNFMNKTTVGPELLRNSTAAAQAMAEYQNNKTGPYTLALGNAAVFLPLRTTHSSISTFLSSLASQKDDAYLAPNLPAAVIRGYATQKRILHKQFSALDNAAYETPFQDSCSRFVIMQKPLSRGSIHINPKDPYGAPIIDSRVFSNPLDVDQAIEFVKFGRRFMNAPSLARLRPVETGPGSFVSSNNTVELQNWVKRTSGPSSFHVCGTTPLMPEDLGGVVDPQLRVYGVGKLRIVDAGVFPLVPGTHLSATVYAVAEKAADLIKGKS